MVNSGHSSKILSLNIIGGGKLGQTLGKLFYKHGVFRINEVVNSSVESARKAVEFIGCGRAIGTLSEMSVADAYMITTPDDVIESVVEELASQHNFEQYPIVFHTCGALGSELLKSARAQGALVASVHPIKSVAEQNAAFETFSGTLCGAEGDEQALTVLSSAFESIGVHVIKINSTQKIIYHAGHVFASNYLVTLLSLAIQCYKIAGVSNDDAIKIIKSLSQGTLDNVIKLGPEAALTGPIARQEAQLIQQQFKTLSGESVSLGEAYQKLGLETVKLISGKPGVSDEKLQAILQTLNSNTN